MNKLVIVESPSKSKTIEKYLGKDYKVLSSKGHIRDLQSYGKHWLGVDIENDFEPIYIPAKGKSAVIKELKAAAKDADEIYLATDPDREGEAISWHLAQVLDVDLDKDNRVVFNEITKDAVQEAFKHPRKVDMALVESQETRRILDRIIGFKLSGLLQKKIKSRSAGRVQSVALKLIADRENEIKAFIPEEYWTIHADFIKDGVTLETELVKIDGKKPDLKDQESSDRVVSECQNEFTVSDVAKKNRNKKSKLPFITSTMQQEASTRLGFNARKTMMVAQQLYEGIEVDGETQGLITYMRTDSYRLSPAFINPTLKYIEDTYGKEYVGAYRPAKNESAQDAHEAIRPTSIYNTPAKVKSYITPDQYRLYSFIYARTVASLMANAKMETNTITFTQNQYDFTISGSLIVFDGYLRIYAPYEQVTEVTLPVIEKDETFKAEKLEGVQHFTEPPGRYTEARLIKELEELGIGRPSTYATIIDSIRDRGYAEMESKSFKPTDRGMLTNVELQKFFNDIINEKYTANMENDLDKIADNEEDKLEVLTDFYSKFVPLLENAEKNMEEIKPEETGEKCPDCDDGMLVIRDGRYGKFISCNNFPDCKYTRNIDGKEKPKPKELDRECPDCGKPLLQRKNRFGNYFIGCSGFPKCRFIENIPDDEQPDDAAVHQKKDDKDDATDKKAKPKKKTPTKKKVAAKKTPTKKPVAKKTAAKKITPKKTTAKKTVKKETKKDEK